MAWAEVLGADHIYVGVNAVDYSGYPDCRPAFIEAFETMANLATKAGIEGHRLTIHAPLIDLSKAQIIQRGTELGVDYGLTVSCYQADDDGRALHPQDVHQHRLDAGMGRTVEGEIGAAAGDPFAVNEVADVCH